MNPRGHKGHRLSRPAEERSIINYPETRKDFTTWLSNRDITKDYRRQIVKSLDRLVTVISEPMDIVRMFEPLSRGQRKDLNRALRNLFNFLENMGLHSAFLNLLRTNIPKDHLRVDINVPAEEQIAESLRVMAQANPRYNGIYNLIVDSGLRLVEAVRLYNTLSESEIHKCDRFNVVPLGYFRECKIAYYGFITDNTIELLLKSRGNVSYNSARRYLNKYVNKGRPRIITWKYLRKFVFDKMIELGVPESVADFIEGRVPKRIGAKHYMVLLRQAKNFYPRYEEYVTSLRNKAGLEVLS